PQKSEDIDIDHGYLDGTYTHIFHDLSTRHPITGEFQLNKVYRINVQNNEGESSGSCSVNINFTLTNPIAINVTSLTSNAKVSCNELNEGEKNDGVIQLQVDNGAGPYS